MMSLMVPPPTTVTRKNILCCACNARGILRHKRLRLPVMTALAFSLLVLLTSRLAGTVATCLLKVKVSPRVALCRLGEAKNMRAGRDPPLVCIQGGATVAMTVLCVSIK